MPNQMMSKLLTKVILSTAYVNLDEAIKSIESYLEEGADPSEVVSLANHDGAITPFSAALQLDNYRLIEAFIKKSKEQNILIKLDADYNYGKISIHKNVFQHACVNNDLDIVNLLIDYGLETGQDMSKICNKRIPVDTTDGTIVVCLNDLMNLTINASSLSASHSISKSAHGDEAGDIISGLKKWRTFSTNINPNTEKPKFPSVITIYATGRADILESLITNNLLDPEVTSIDMHPMHKTLKDLSSYTSIDDFFDDVVSNINTFSNTKLTKDEISINPSENGVFILEMTLVNPSEELKQKFRVIFDLRDSNALVEKRVIDSKIDGNRRHSDEIKKINQRLIITEATLSDVPSVRLKTLRDEFAEHASSLKCLNTVHAKTLNTLTAFNIASTGMIGTKPTEKSAQVATIAQAAFTAVAQSVNVPGATLLPAITKWVLDTSILTNEKNKAKGVVRATTDLDINALSVDVAALIAAEVNMSGCRDDGKLADQLATHVVEQIKQLKKFPEGTFTSSEQVVGFLASAAIAQIQANITKNRAHSNESKTSEQASVTSLSGSERGSVVSHDINQRRKRGDSKGCSVQ